MTTLHLNTQQLENWLCNCDKHHHYMIYLCECLTILTPDTIAEHQKETGHQKKIEFGSTDYNHDDTPEQIWDRLIAYGLVHSQPDFDYFYKKFANMESERLITSLKEKASNWDNNKSWYKNMNDFYKNLAKIKENKTYANE